MQILESQFLEQRAEQEARLNQQETALLNLMTDEQRKTYMFHKRNANTDQETQNLVDELNDLLTGLYPTFMSSHILILVGDVESIEKDLAAIPDVGQEIVDQVFAENSASFLHFTEDTENKGWLNGKYQETVELAANGDANAIRVLEIERQLNPLASDENALDDSGVKKINYSNAEEGIYNGLSMDVGAHHLGFLKFNQLRTLLNNQGYGLFKWYGLEVYGWAAIVFVIKWNDVFNRDNLTDKQYRYGIYKNDDGFLRAALWQRDFISGEQLGTFTRTQLWTDADTAISYMSNSLGTYEWVGSVSTIKRNVIAFHVQTLYA